MNIFLLPLSTEKSVAAQTTGKYTFVIPRQANKIMVKQTLEQFYEVKVTEVQTINLPKKTKMQGRRKTVVKRQPMKKVIITLKKGQTLDMNKMKNK